MRKGDNNGSAEGGFTLIGLMVVIAIINIGLGVAATSWVHISKRQREAELIWRGQQYARAVACHRQQTGGLPDNLEDLLESDCIRALYPDPMTRAGTWRVLRESDVREFGGEAEPESDPFSTLDRQLGGAGISFPDPTAGSGDRGDAPPDALRAAYERLRGLSDRLQESFSSGSGNGIVGVVSTSTGEGLRTYDGEATYDAWRFVVQ